MLLEKLDAYRTPDTSALTPAKARGGILRLTVLCLWVLYVVFSTNEYLSKPPIVLTSLQPSSVYTGNYVNFSFLSPEVASAPTFFWGKYGNFAPCDDAANYKDADEPTPLCPLVMGVAACGVDEKGEDVVMPIGMAYAYAITNQTLMDSIFAFEAGNVFEISAPEGGKVAPELWEDSIPIDKTQPEVKPGQILLSVATVTIALKHSKNIHGKQSTHLLGTSIVVDWVVVDLTISISEWGMLKCSKNMQGFYDNNTDTSSLYFEYLGYNVTLTEGVQYGSWRGLGLVVLSTTDTTIVVEEVSGRQALFTFLGSLGGGFGLL